MRDKKSSFDSLAEASRNRAEFSGHGNALGAAGYKEESTDSESSTHLQEPGQKLAVNPGPDGFKYILIGGAWDNIELKNAGLIEKLAKKAMHKGVDLDIGCLYELMDGTRGSIQAFGEKFGDFDNPPYMRLSGDERTGDTKGYDEYILINGAHWDKIKRLVVYFYIYGGVNDWAAINPRIILDVPGEEDLVVTLRAHDDSLCVCAVGGLEQVRGGIVLTNYTEYFPGHEEMDRAFGFGLEWAEGQKE